jgi:hypothetical protein
MSGSHAWYERRPTVEVRRDAAAGDAVAVAAADHAMDPLGDVS